MIQHVQAAELIHGEKLYHIQAVLDGGSDLAGRDAAGNHGNLLIQAVFHHLPAPAGHDDELCAVVDGLLGRIQIVDRSGAHDDLRDIFGDARHVGHGVVAAHQHLHHGQTAGNQCLGGGDGHIVLGRGDDGADAGNFQNIIH